MQIYNYRNKVKYKKPSYAVVADRTRLCPKICKCKGILLTYITCEDKLPALPQNIIIVSNSQCKYLGEFSIFTFEKIKVVWGPTCYRIVGVGQPCLLF